MEVRHLRRPFPAATVEFWAHSLCGCPHTHRWHPSKFWPNPKHHDGAVIFSHFERRLLASLLACLLAKPVRSTLDTKEGYETKTGSTSSVTLTRIDYWDLGGGGRIMVYFNDK